jgi:serine/threonine protein kinase
VFKKKLGFGSYGEVFLLEKMVNGEPKLFAVKTLRRKTTKKKVKAFMKKKSQSTNRIMDEDVRNEIAAMKKIRHYNIVAINEVICNADK